MVGLAFPNSVATRPALLFPLSYTSFNDEKINPPSHRCGNLFFHRKTTVMTYYLIYQENELRLIPVRPEQEESFSQRYAQRVLATGLSPLEALRTFDALPLVFCDGV